jgi:hypothetical protein
MWVAIGLPDLPVCCRLLQWDLPVFCLNQDFQNYKTLEGVFGV